MEKRRLKQISEIFHDKTKMRRCVFESNCDGIYYSKKLPVKYPFANKLFHLPPNNKLKKVSLEDAVKNRTSTRFYSHKPLTINILSEILYYSYGVTGIDKNRIKEIQEVRTVPSAGALYPIDLYLIAINVKGLKSGIYFYDPFKHILVLVKYGNFRKALSHAICGHKAASTMAAAIMLNAVFKRTKDKYGERGYRYVLLDAGHIGQNMYLAASGLNVGIVTWGGFIDNEINAIIGADGLNEAVVYFSTLGDINHLK